VAGLGVGAALELGGFAPVPAETAAVLAARTGVTGLGHDSTTAPASEPAASAASVASVAAPISTAPPARTSDLGVAITADPGATSGRAAEAGASRATTGWVCGGSARITDAQPRRWSVGRVSFRAMGDHERVILHLDRTGVGGDVATASGHAFGTSAVRGDTGGGARPASARSAIGIALGGGMRGGLTLRAFRPQGLQAIRELSIGRSGLRSRVLISVAPDACFRLRAPAWEAGTSPDATTAQLIMDVRP
jgi:hypothetical protein